MFSLIIEGKEYFEADVITSNSVHPAIVFCQKWLSGQTEFEVKTSGSTGTPKKIPITRDQMQTSAEMTADVLSLSSGDSCLVCLNPEHIAGKMMLVRSMVVCMKATYIDATANPLGAVFGEFDFSAMVPLQIRSTRENNPLALNRVKKLIIGGAGLHQEDLDYVKHLNNACYATYGMTETVSHIALQRLNGYGQKSYFTLMPGVVVDMDDRGCLTIKGLVTNGEQIITNDVVEMLDYDKFVWKGRIDNVINTGGIKVSAEKVEQSLAVLMSDLQKENQYFVAGLPDSKLGSRVVLFVEGEEFIVEKEELERYLTKYEVPKEVHFLSKFPITTSGKIDKQKVFKELQLSV